MPRSVHRLAGWQRVTLYAAGSLLLATGLLWLALRYGRAADTLPSPLEPWVMKVHGLAAFAALFMFGVLAASHVPLGWRLSLRRRWARQRSSGLALCTLAALLALTSYLLYYFAPEGIRDALGWVHSGLGAAALPMLLMHRRTRSQMR